MVQRRVKLELRSITDPSRQISIEAIETPAICSSFIPLPSRQVRNHLNERGLQLADSELTCLDSPQISLLIGSDNYWRLVMDTTIRLSETLMAIETALGWVVQGSTGNPTSPITCSTHVMKITVEESLPCEEESTSEILRKFWELDAIGIVEKPDSASSIEHDAVLKKFEESCIMKEGRYEVGFPWKETCPELGNNLAIAYKRLEWLVQKFKRNPELYARYKEVIDEYLQKGIMEKVRPEQTPPDGKTYYMPHHAVIKEERTTTKLRVVFDASSHAKGMPSLNDCLHPGPNLNPNLLEVLVNFRLHLIAFVADIEKAFLQIEIKESDRDAIRLLWVPDVATGNTRIEVLRMTRVPFGTTPSPFLLAATIRKHAKDHAQDFPVACDMLNRYLYVDDLVTGSNSVNEALNVTKDIKRVLAKAGMNMRKWKTNSTELRQEWANAQEIKEETEAQTTEGAHDVQKILGVSWDSQTDELVLKGCGLPDLMEKSLPTKRSVLRAIARMYDPLGILTPVSIRMKIFFQELWVKGISWDENLPEDLQEKWSDLSKELSSSNTISVPRCCFPRQHLDNQRVQLHCFSDASQEAYGAVLYLRSISPDGQFCSRMLLSKARVAPVKKVTLPRLELMGALLSVRLASKVRSILERHLQVEEFFWTDSSIALTWVRSPAEKWKPFIQNRVSEIHEKSEPSSWFFCPGSENPADLLTRGLTMASLTTCERWWHGPEFLQEEQESWPRWKLNETRNEEIESEIRYGQNTRETVISLAVPETRCELIQLDKFSNIGKLIRVTAWVFRFIENTRHPSEKISGPLSKEERQSSHDFWIKRSQQSAYGLEISALKNHQSLPSTSSILALRPFLDANHILRIGGRLQESGLQFEQIHPILLSGKDHLSTLVIMDAHKRVGHGGVDDTLVQTRDHYWVVKGRQRVKAAIKGCNICKRFSAKPMMQETAPLPADRVKESAPFQVVGVDFVGPLFVKTKDGPEKAYIILITCAATRAVHLELVPDMTAESCMLAFRRFVGRRGICSIVYSDNAKAFQRVAGGLNGRSKQQRQGNKLAEFFGDYHIEWKFIPSRAAWWGGFWERLIRSLKSVLRKTLGKALLDFQEMTTTIVEIEGILNSRPITYVYGDAMEPSPLTPSHFLIGRRLSTLPLGTTTFTSSNTTRDQLTKRWKYQQTLINRVWKRWRSSYLMDLRSARSAPRCKTEPRQLKVGDVVIVHEDKLPRTNWKLGVVEKLHPGRDGKVRVCDVRLGNQSTVKRAVQHLYHLEVD